jgi:hypothetical protein
MFEKSPPQFFSGLQGPGAPLMQQLSIEEPRVGDWPMGRAWPEDGGSKVPEKCDGTVPIRKELQQTRQVALDVRNKDWGVIAAVKPLKLVGASSAGKGPFQIVVRGQSGHGIQQLFWIGFRGTISS